MGAFGLSSCNPNPEQTILGSWKLNNYESDQEIPAEFAENFKTEISKMIENTEVIFKENGEMDVITAGVPIHGSWKLSEDGKYLTMTGSFENTAEVVKLDKHNFQLKASEGDYEILLSLTKLPK